MHSAEYKHISEKMKAYMEYIRKPKYLLTLYFIQNLL